MNEEVSTPSPVKVYTNPTSHFSSSMAPSSTSSTITPMKQRSRGISLNIAVSPASPQLSNSSFMGPNNSSHNHNNSHNSHNNHNSNGSGTTANGYSHHRRNSSANTLPQLSESPWEELKYDLPLPETDSLMNMDIDEQLRLLALKEMSVVEIKDHIGTLQTKLKKHEGELHRLREVIQRTLYKEMGSSSNTSNNIINTTNNNTTNNNGSSEPRDAAVRSTKRRSRTLSLTGSTISEENDLTEAPISRTNSIQTPSKKNNVVTKQPPQTKPDRSSSIWSNLSKPLNLIQQFDTMLQNEFEKSLIPQEHQIPKQNQHPHQEDNTNLPRRDHKYSDSNESVRTSEDSTSSGMTAASSPLKDKHPAVSQVGSSYEEKIQTVSSSIWSFVSDVRTNVMSSLADEGTEVMYNIDTGSTISLNETQNVDTHIIKEAEVDKIREFRDKGSLVERKLKTS
ncbi:topoisomerase I damage affected protein 11 [[Candida] railenensis]|uniref:Topoisomerase I damage affected protein 11 n=1 Tax=[Candida] railenensis TaxID=45579 RepID=A0A9P0QUH0_9ASCO|nr:topoisomerase I damage affected protein 11 [[Candida] railenensis]